MSPRSPAVLRTSPPTARSVGFFYGKTDRTMTMIYWKNMDTTCAWQCKPTEPQEEEKYCVGSGTDMFMQGFAVRKEGNFNEILTFISKVGQ